MLKIRVSDNTTVSGLLVRPDDADCLFVFGHGAGAGMEHPFMEELAQTLAGRRVATLRYNFPYIEAGRRRPDFPNRLLATVRAAVGRAADLAPDLPLIAGGKSMGGRMTSTAASTRPLPSVRGLAFVGFPLHAPAKPGSERGEHLLDVDLPMLFLQGTRDRLARLDLLEPLLERIRPAPELHTIEGADHSFQVPKSLGRSQGEVMAELAETLRGWVDRLGVATAAGSR